MRKKIALSIVFSMLCLAAPGSQTLASPQGSGTDKTYEMGVFPFLPPRELEKIFAPFASSIGDALGKQVHFQSARTYQDFMSRTDEQQYGIIFVQPFDYIRLADAKRYVPLATRQEMLSAVVVTKSDSALPSIKSLSGKTIAMPPRVAAVSRLTKNLLSKNGLEPGKNITITHHRSHASCLQQVLIGQADACASAAPAIRFIEKKMKVTFKEIARTQKIPHTLFAASTRLNQAERKIILDTILSWSESPIGKKMLERGRMNPFRPINDEAYDVVRDINAANPL